MTKLNERTVLTTLHIGAWGGKSVDPEVTEEVEESHKAEHRNSGTYSKKLIAPKFLRDVGSKVSVARRTHRILTLPWDDSARILSTTGYLHYTEQMRLQRLGMEAAVANFIQGYPEYIKEAKVRLGTMFSADDYPEKDTLRKKFMYDVEIRPVPTAGDFRAELSDSSIKAITKDIEARSNDRLKAATADVFERIFDGVSKMAERLKAFVPAIGEEKAEGVFRDSLVWNLAELADLLPSLNISEDKRLDDLQKQLKEQLTANSPELLRDDEKLRRQTAEKAEKLAAKVKKFLG